MYLQSISDKKMFFTIQVNDEENSFSLHPFPFFSDTRSLTQELTFFSNFVQSNRLSCVNGTSEDFVMRANIDEPYEVRETGEMIR